MTDEELYSYARAALLRISERELAGVFQIRWNPRMRSAAGRAKLQTWSMEINPRLLLMEQNGELEVRRTALHELAHLVAWKRAGDRGHGAEWRKACAELGIPNEKVTHTLPLPVRRQKKRWLYKCNTCQESFKRVKKVKHKVACAYCCKAYNKGRFTPRFLLEEIPLVSERK